MIFVVWHGKIRMSQRCFNTLGRGAGISSPARVYRIFAPANLHTSPSGEVAMMDIILTPERQDQFWAKVDKRSPDDCWLWQGGYGKGSNDGYGFFSISPGKTARAHRVAYVLTGRQIPEGLVIDHLCRNRLCVNPAHLECVTNGENLRRGNGCSGMNFRKTHCPKGHVYGVGNVRIRPSGRRECRTCASVRKADRLLDPEYRERKRQRDAAAWERRKLRKESGGEK